MNNVKAIFTLLPADKIRSEVRILIRLLNYGAQW
jgi:hypothetical protein